MELPNSTPPFPRTKCSCDRCAAGCKTMPGSLIPGDLDRIQAYVGDRSGDFILSHFQASDGAKVAARVGGMMILTRVPTIVPAQRKDGRCVFLDDDNLCSIHEVAPFGCAYHDVHLSEEEAAPRSEYAVMQQLPAQQAPASPYVQWHGLLVAAGMVAAPLDERREAMETMINELERRTPPV